MRWMAFWTEHYTHENCMGQDTGTTYTECSGEIMGYVHSGTTAYAIVRVSRGYLQQVNIGIITSVRSIGA